MLGTVLKLVLVMALVTYQAGSMRVAVQVPVLVSWLQPAWVLQLPSMLLAPWAVLPVLLF